MKDSEVRGVILKRLYEVRHSDDGMISLPDGLDITDIPPAVLGNCAAQLDEQGLIKFHQYLGGSYRAGHGHITAYGIDVVEGNSRPAIAVVLDQSVNVHGSQNVQIGGQGNVQNVKMDIDRLTSMVNSIGGTQTEKEEAKSLLRRIAENKLVRAVLGKWLAGTVD